MTYLRHGYLECELCDQLCNFAGEFDGHGDDRIRRRFSSGMKGNINGAICESDRVRRRKAIAFWKS